MPTIPKLLKKLSQKNIRQRAVSESSSNGHEYQRSNSEQVPPLPVRSRTSSSFLPWISDNPQAFRSSSPSTFSLSETVGTGQPPDPIPPPVPPLPYQLPPMVSDVDRDLTSTWNAATSGAPRPNNVTKVGKKLAALGDNSSRLPLCRYITAHNYREYCNHIRDGP